MSLERAAHFAIPEALVIDNSSDSQHILVQTGMLVSEIIQTRIESFDDTIEKLNNATTEQQSLDILLEAAKLLFNGQIKVLPLFKLPNANQHNQTYETRETILNGNNKAITSKWLHQVSRIRENSNHLEDFLLYQELFASYDQDEINLCVQQLPYRENDSWVGNELPVDYFRNHNSDIIQVSRDKLSLVSLITDNVRSSLSNVNNISQSNFAGLLIDEWNEVIPNDQETSGVSFHYDRPNCEAPQAILMMVPPLTGAFTIDYITRSNNTVLELSKIRSVEPDDLNEPMWFEYNPNPGPGLQKLFFSHLLPGILGRAIDYSHEMDISNDFGLNNKSENSQLFDFSDNFPNPPGHSEEQNPTGGGST